MIVSVLIETLTDVLAVGIIGVVTSIGVGVLIGVNANFLVVMMTCFEFAMPVPLLEESTSLR